MHWQSHHRKLLALAETGETLTTSQQTVYEFLHQAIEDYQQRINLWGSPGVGKTFLAHYLHYCAEGLYFFLQKIVQAQKFPLILWLSLITHHLIEVWHGQSSGTCFGLAHLR